MALYSFGQSICEVVEGKEKGLVIGKGLRSTPGAVPLLNSACFCVFFSLVLNCIQSIRVYKMAGRHGVLHYNMSQALSTFEWPYHTGNTFSPLFHVLHTPSTHQLRTIVSLGAVHEMSKLKNEEGLSNNQRSRQSSISLGGCHQMVRRRSSLK